MNTSVYDIIVLDYSTGRAFTTTIEKPTEDDFEEYVDAKLESLGIRLEDCSWMELKEEVENI